MITGQELKSGNKVIYEWDPYEIVNSEHLKVAQGKGLSKVSMRNLKTGNMLSGQTFREVDKFEEADITVSSYDYLYNDGDNFYFMNQANFEQVQIPTITVGDAKDFLMEGDKVKLMEWEGTPINIQLEPSVTLEVIETPPGEKWDSTANNKKPATLSTGLTIQVPLFIGQWEKIRVDTREYTYLWRA